MVLRERMNASPHEPLIPATLVFSADGTPYSESYGDVYHSAAGGLGQARHVFVGGNDLPRRWRMDEQVEKPEAAFCIVETGFGTGLNFLATWEAWNDAGNHVPLHYIAFEKHPFAAADLAALHAAWPELAPLARELRAAWPPLVRGWQRLHFAGGKLTLDLFFGDAKNALAQLPAQCQADAFYLDGFAPTKNPELWDASLLAALSRHASPGATLATWTVAAAVRTALEQNGWRWRKTPGYAQKREMLCAVHEKAASVVSAPSTNSAAPSRPRFSSSSRASSFLMPESPESPTPPTARHAIVIGAGLAGTSVAERLAARGWDIDLIDRLDAPGQGASGNLAGVLRPLPSADDNRLARLTRAAFLYTGRHLAALEAEGLPLSWGRTGVLHLARDALHEETQRRVVAVQKPPADYLRFLEREEARECAGWPVENGGWWFPGGAWVGPASLCRANLLRHPERIRGHFGCEVARIFHDRKLWNVSIAGKSTTLTAPVLVLANAADARRLLGGIEATEKDTEDDVENHWLPLFPARGQVTHLPAAPEKQNTPGTSFPPHVVVCRLGYVTPAVDGLRCAGATFLMRDSDPQLRAADHRENLAKLDFILPGYRAALFGEFPPDEDTLAALPGRVGFRPAAPDRLPMLGPVPDALRWAALPDAGRTAPLATFPRLPGLWLCNGFGARGLVWSAWAGEILASRIAEVAPPLERELLDALDPARFLNRRTRKVKSGNAKSGGV